VEAWGLQPRAPKRRNSPLRGMDLRSRGGAGESRAVQLRPPPPHQLLALFRPSVSGNTGGMAGAHITETIVTRDLPLRRSTQLARNQARFPLHDRSFRFVFVQACRLGFPRDFFFLSGANAAGLLDSWALGAASFLAGAGPSDLALEPVPPVAGREEGSFDLIRIREGGANVAQPSIFACTAKESGAEGCSFFVIVAGGGIFRPTARHAHSFGLICKTLWCCS